MTPLHHHNIGRGILAHHSSGPQNYVVSLGDCMELITCPNECFVQVGFRNWPPHMHMSHTYVPAHATATAPAPAHTTAQAHVSPPNGQCHLTLGPHMLCLCEHVAHPCTCTQTRCIVQRAPTMSPTHAELFHGYTKLGQHIICPWFAHHTDHPRDCVVGSTSVTR
ncbi:hypothetical protein O181_110500 [Austropuccinia psidii MF-1]|uniref:Uncharacterized protein n=1 Tax=Austropuccinia psidii MF-1 TaxID=1389203 RepID=A0A9Q3PRL6_9BASI|nr:hypothetical protein [Austropuccinia psidii MF-1]